MTNQMTNDLFNFNFLGATKYNIFPEAFCCDHSAFRVHLQNVSEGVTIT